MRSARSCCYFVLSTIAGSVDVIGFLGLGGLFITHITGNLAVPAAKLVVDDQAPVSHLLSVPVFIVALTQARLLASRLTACGLLPCGLCSLCSSCFLSHFSPSASAPVRASIRMRQP